MGLCFTGSKPKTSTGLMSFRFSDNFCFVLSTGVGGTISSSSSLASTCFFFDNFDF